MTHEEQGRKLVYMANQIATFFAHEPDEIAIAEITNHLAKFWEKRMREQIIALAATDTHGLLPRALAAVKRLG